MISEKDDRKKKEEQIWKLDSEAHVLLSFNVSSFHVLSHNALS